MYKKLGCYKDKKNFGNQVIVYKSNKDYFVIIKDREEVVYYLVDDNINKLYPMNSYMKKIGFVYCEESNDLNCFDIDLSLYEHSNCPEYLQKIIKNMIDSQCIESKIWSASKK